MTFFRDVICALIQCKLIEIVHISPDKWNDLKIKIILYADDTTLYDEVASPTNHKSVANFLNKDLFKFNYCAQRRKMKLNSSKTHSVIISRFRTLLSLYPTSTLCGVDLEVSSFLKCFGVIFDKIK